MCSRSNLTIKAAGDRKPANYVIRYGSLAWGIFWVAEIYARVRTPLDIVRFEANIEY